MIRRDVLEREAGENTNASPILRIGLHLQREREEAARRGEPTLPPLSAPRPSSALVAEPSERHARMCIPRSTHHHHSCWEQPVELLSPARLSAHYRIPNFLPHR